LIDIENLLRAGTVPLRIAAPCTGQPQPSRFGSPGRFALNGVILLRDKEVSEMNVIADLCVVPVGVGVSVSRYVAACESVLKEAGLSIRLHAHGTNIEGEWDQVLSAVKRCHEVVHEMGAPRVSTNLRLGTRTDRSQTMEDKIRSVEEKL
jgi:uncharacterized protein (TIGR00106 family)